MQELKKNDKDASAATNSPTTGSANIGFVTTLEELDHPIVEKAMEIEPDPIRTAGLLPPAQIIERFTSYFPPNTPFSYILLRLTEITQTHSRFHMCELKEQLKIADVLHPIKDLTTNDRILLCASPATIREKKMEDLFRDMATCVAEQRGGGLLDIPSLNLEVLDQQPTSERKYLNELEILHKGIILYLWLSYRFSGIFHTRSLAFQTKTLVEDAIEKCLNKFNFTRGARNKLKEMREENLLVQLQQTMWDKGEDNDPPLNGHDRNETTIDDTRDVAAITNGVDSEMTGRGQSDTPQPVDDLNQFPIPELELDKDGSDVPGLDELPITAGQDCGAPHERESQTSTHYQDRNGKEEEATNGNARTPATGSVKQDRAVDAEDGQITSLNADSLDSSPALEPAIPEHQQTQLAERVGQGRHDLDEKQSKSA